MNRLTTLSCTNRIGDWHRSGSERRQLNRNAPDQNENVSLVNLSGGRSARRATRFQRAKASLGRGNGLRVRFIIRS